MSQVVQQVYTVQYVQYNRYGTAFGPKHVFWHLQLGTTENNVFTWQFRRTMFVACCEHWSNVVFVTAIKLSIWVVYQKRQTRCEDNSVDDTSSREKVFHIRRLNVIRDVYDQPLPFSFLFSFHKSGSLLPRWRPRRRRRLSSSRLALWKHGWRQERYTVTVSFFTQK